jgi:hypothetical protein
MEQCTANNCNVVDSVFLVLVYEVTRSRKLYLCKDPFAQLIPSDLSEARNGGLHAALG